MAKTRISPYAASQPGSRGSFEPLSQQPKLQEALVGIFDRKEKKPDFSNVQGGSSSAPSAGAGSAAAPARSPEQSAERTYTVQSGDSLSKIAKREYGDANQWRRIFEANKDQIENPDLIYPGQKLRIPA